ncbi:MAG: DUF1657 domain-containing protein [Mahellales bacterium]
MTVASQLKQTLVSLKGAQATLRIYSAQTQDQETRDVYNEVLGSTHEIIADLEKRLNTLELEEPQYKGL